MLGRGTTANIRVRAEGVSRSHASVMLQVDGTMLLADLGFLTDAVQRGPGGIAATLPGS